MMPKENTENSTATNPMRNARVGMPPESANTPPYTAMGEMGTMVISPHTTMSFTVRVALKASPLFCLVATVGLVTVTPLFSGMDMRAAAAGSMAFVDAAPAPLGAAAAAAAPVAVARAAAAAAAG